MDRETELGVPSEFWDAGYGNQTVARVWNVPKISRITGADLLSQFG